MSESLLRLEDLVSNPTARIPVCLCLDTSGSMDGDPIKELNEGVRIFYDAIKEDETAKFSAEICIVTFGGDQPELIEDFANIERQRNVFEFEANGVTPMGAAVCMALDCLERRKEEYKAKGVDYFQPWLVLMTDGEPTDGSTSDFHNAVSRTVELIKNRKLTIFPIGIGDSADMGTLAKFSPNRTPLKLKGLNFREFFLWLSQSTSRTSQNMPGENIELDVSGIKSWAMLNN